MEVEAGACRGCADPPEGVVLAVQSAGYPLTRAGVQEKKPLCFVAYIFRGELFKLFRIQLIHLFFHVCQLTFRRLLLCFALHKEGAFPSGFFFKFSVISRCLETLGLQRTFSEGTHLTKK